jgi:predicted DNA-binding transcriptional regulator AlpA
MSTMVMAETAEPYSFLEFCKQIGFKASLHNEDRVFTIAEWAQASSISQRTARELIASGAGPRVVELSPNRLGIRVCDHREWLAARTRSA